MLIWPMSALQVVPPVVEDAEPLSFAEGMQVVVAIALLWWLSVRFRDWIEVKMPTKRLLREIRRELTDRSRHGRGSS